jgi:hypothetical protein
MTPRLRAQVHHPTRWPATHPLHARCTRVVTKETLTQELPELLKSGIAA